MDFRIFELTNDLNAIIDCISNYCNIHNYEINVKEITYKQDYLPSDLELRDNPNARRREGIASYGGGIISISPLSSQMIWYIAWLAYRIKNNDNVENEAYIIRQLIAIDKGEEYEPLDNLPDWNLNELDKIFCCSIGFLICHELGHAVFQHPGYLDEELNPRDPSILKTNELEADSFAVKCILEILNSDEMAKYGILAAQLSLFFIRNKEEHYINHPNPDTRLENVSILFDLNKEMQSFIEKAKELSMLYLENRFV